MLVNQEKKYNKQTECKFTQNELCQINEWSYGRIKTQDGIILLSSTASVVIIIFSNVNHKTLH